MLDVGVIFVYLCDSDDEGNTGFLDRSERIKRLRHYAFICRNNEDSDVGCRRSARAKRFKGLVAWCIEKGDRAVIMQRDVGGRAG